MTWTKEEKETNIIMIQVTSLIFVTLGSVFFVQMKNPITILIPIIVMGSLTTLIVLTLRHYGNARQIPNGSEYTITKLINCEDRK